MAGPAFTRLDVDERRAQLLDLGTGLFTRFSYDELSMAQIAREAGISKALLYHYFPSKQAYFTATLQDKAAELAALTEPDTSLPALEQIAGSLDAFLRWIEANGDAYASSCAAPRPSPRCARSSTRVRDATAGGSSRGSRRASAPPAQLRTAVRAWLWFMDGAILDWIEHGDIKRKKLGRLLLGTLVGAVTAAGEGALLDRK